MGTTQVDIILNSILKEQGLKNFISKLDQSRREVNALSKDIDRLAAAGVKIRKMGDNRFSFVKTNAAGSVMSEGQVIDRLNLYEQGLKRAAAAQKEADAKKLANSTAVYTQKLMGAISATNKLADDTKRLAAAGLGTRKNKSGERYVYDLQTNQAVGHKEVAMRVQQADMATKHYNETVDKFKKTMKEMPGSLARLADGYKIARTAGQNMFTSAGFGLKHFSSGFNMAYLSLMFFSMAILNVFKRLAMGTVSTFVEMADKTDMARMGIEKLKVGFTVLKFAIGEALANYLLPMIPAILDFVDKVLLWIDKNDELVGSIVKWGLILGGGGFILAQFILGIAGVVNALGTLALWFGRIATKSTAAAGELTKLKTVLAGLQTMGLIAGIGFGVKFIVDTWKILSKDGTTMAEYSSLISEGAIAGALIGQFFGGLAGAAIGAAIGAVAGIIVMGIDVHFEVKDMIVTSDLPRWQVEQATRAAVYKTESEHPIIAFAGETALKHTGWFKENFQTELDAWSEYNREVQAMRDKQSTLDIYGGKEATMAAGEQVAAQIRALTSSLYDAGTTGENLEITNQIADLNQELVNISAATGVSAEQFNSVAAAQQMAAEKTRNVTSAYESFDDVLQNNIVSAQEFIQSVQPEKISKLGDELDAFVSRMDDLDYTSINKLGTAFISLGQILGGTQEEAGLLSALQDTVNKIDGEDDSVVSAMDALHNKINEVSTTLESVLIPQVNSASYALESNTTAAINAAMAQERYNRAVDGAFG